MHKKNSKIKITIKIQVKGIIHQNHQLKKRNHLGFKVETIQQIKLVNYKTKFMNKN